MLGHLKAEEFISMIDGVRLSQGRHVHLESCRACAEKLQSIRSIHGFLANEDDAIPEPEWDQFRESVRVELLSRSVKRDSVVRRWTGWPIRPAVAWGFSFVLLICVGAGGYFWHLSGHQTE